MIEIRETLAGRVLIAGILLGIFALFLWLPDRSLGHWLGIGFFAAIAAKWLWLMRRGDVVLCATSDGVASRDFKELGIVPRGAFQAIFASGAILYLILEDPDAFWRSAPPYYRVLNPFIRKRLFVSLASSDALFDFSLNAKLRALCDEVRRKRAEEPGHGA